MGATAPASSVFVVRSTCLQSGFENIEPYLALKGLVSNVLELMYTTPLTFRTDTNQLNYHSKVAVASQVKDKLLYAKRGRGKRLAPGLFPGYGPDSPPLAQIHCVCCHLIKNRNSEMFVYDYTLNDLNLLSF